MAILLTFAENTIGGHLAKPDSFDKIQSVNN